MKVTTPTTKFLVGASRGWIPTDSNPSLVFGTKLYEENLMLGYREFSTAHT